MQWDFGIFVIVTSDESLLRTLGGKLQEWGNQVLHYDPFHPSELPRMEISVAMVDVRRNAQVTLRQLSGLRREMPYAETILINSDGNISASMAGMQAGASDELTVPFDMKGLKKTVSAACLRSKKRQDMKKWRPLLDFFEKTMTVATFAQAGEFETAISLLDTSGAKETKEQETIEKKAVQNQKNRHV